MEVMQTKEPGQATIPKTCRTCWEREPNPELLCEPCACKGSQRHVHIACLRRWQEAVQKLDPDDERAYRCSVCRTRFSLPPPQPRWTAHLMHVLRAIGGTACISLLAFGLSGPPWPHLALLLLLLVGTRSHSLLAVALLLMGSAMAALHAKGLRMILRVDGTGRLALAVVRHGPPVDGLGPGTLLVASEELGAGIFRRSVVLLTHHSRTRGARGVILTQPMSAPPQLPTLPNGVGAAVPGHAEAEVALTNAPAPTLGCSAQAIAVRNAGRRSAAGAAGGTVTVPAPDQLAAKEPLIQHHLGGPIGMPGEGIRQEMVLLHSVRGVPGSSLLLPLIPAPATNSTGSAAAGAATSSGSGSASLQADRLRVYEGGELADVLELAGVQVEGRRPQPAVFIFHGVCAWAEGQLEGEVRSGHWGFAPALVEDVVSLPAARSLWQSLTVSNRISWLAA